MDNNNLNADKGVFSGRAGQYVVLGTIFILAFSLKLLRLDVFECGGDAVEYWLSVNTLFDGITRQPVQLFRLSRLSLIVATFIAKCVAFGHPFSYNMPAMLMFAAMACGTYMLGLRLGGKAVGLASAVMLCLFDPFTRLSVQLLPDGYEAGFLLGSVLFLVVYLQERKVFWVALSAALLFLSYSARFTVMLSLPGYLLVFWLVRAQKRDVLCFFGVLASLYSLEWAYLASKGAPLGRLDVILYRRPGSLARAIPVKSFSTFFERWSDNQMGDMWTLVRNMFLVSAPYILWRGRIWHRALVAVIMSHALFMTFGLRNLDPPYMMLHFVSRYFAIYGPLVLVCSAWAVNDMARSACSALELRSATGGSRGGIVARVVLMLLVVVFGSRVFPVLELYEQIQLLGAGQHALQEIPRYRDMFRKAYAEGTPIMVASKGKGDNVGIKYKGISSIYIDPFADPPPWNRVRLSGREYLVFTKAKPDPQAWIDSLPGNTPVVYVPLAGRLAPGMPMHNRVYPVKASLADVRSGAAHARRGSKEGEQTGSKELFEGTRIYLKRIAASLGYTVSGSDGWSERDYLRLIAELNRIRINQGSGKTVEEKALQARHRDQVFESLLKLNGDESSIDVPCPVYRYQYEFRNVSDHSATGPVLYRPAAENAGAESIMTAMNTRYQLRPGESATFTNYNWGRYFQGNHPDRVQEYYNGYFRYKFRLQDLQGKGVIARKEQNRVVLMTRSAQVGHVYVPITSPYPLVGGEIRNFGISEPSLLSFYDETNKQSFHGLVVREDGTVDLNFGFALVGDQPTYKYAVVIVVPPGREVWIAADFIVVSDFQIAEAALLRLRHGEIPVRFDFGEDGNKAMFRMEIRMACQ